MIGAFTLALRHGVQNETVVERASMREDLMEVVAQLARSTYHQAPDKAARVLYHMMHAPGAADKAMRSPVCASLGAALYSVHVRCDCLTRCATRGGDCRPR